MTERNTYLKNGTVTELDIQGNQGADTLADQGVAGHADISRLIVRAAKRKELTRLTQNMMVAIWSDHRKEEESMDIEGIRAMSDAYPPSSEQYNDFDYDPFAHNYNNDSNVEIPTSTNAAPRTSLEERFPAYPWDTSQEDSDTNLKINVPDGTDLDLFRKTTYKKGGYVKGAAHTFQKDVPHDLWQPLADWVAELSWTPFQLTGGLKSQTHSEM